MAKTIIIYAKLFPDFAGQKLSELSIVSQSYLKNKMTQFFETWCISGTTQSENSKILEIYDNVAFI